MTARRENGLSGETSPYLLQHRHNPVDWSPWGPAALERARREDKPIFLSIGYAACHWCHVMERESFEDESIAALLNDRFVPIKVDREERPDIDEIYMTAVQLMTGQGGWPLNVFLTPSLEPFYGGTYWPPVDRHGRPGLPTVLRHLDAAWREKREEIASSAATIVAHLRDAASPALPAGERPVGAAERKRAVAQLAGRFDAGRGGFGAAPKFPPHGAIALLLREWRRSGERTPLRMAEETLDAMARGGIYDQFGGGFARYSVDDRWLVPHFEKMLYDQALLVPVYADAWLVTGAPRFRRVALETLDFVRREMTHPEGGFFSSIDADSEGEEGRFYLWTPEEIAAVLGEAEAREVCRAFDVTPEGNFEGRSIPHLAPGSPERAWPKERLREARDRRPRPATDDKVLTAWNGLMITAYARAAQAFGRDEDLASARRAAAFALTRLTDPERGLRVSWRAGVAKHDAFLDDHGFLARGLLDLYEAGFDRAHLDAAADLARRAARRFAREGGGFWFASSDHEALPARATSSHDGALPSGAGVAAETFLRLASHLDDDGLREAGVAALTALAPLVERAPSAFASLLVAADFLEGPVDELVIAGPLDDGRTRALLAAARSRYLPNRIWAWAAPGDPRPLVAGRASADRPALYVCRDHACRAPVHDPGEVEGALGEAP